MADHSQLVAEFSNVTGADSERAKFYLESAAWKLEVALASFYDEDDGGDIEPVEDASSAQGAVPASHAAPPPRGMQDPPRSRGPMTGSRFATLSSMQPDEDSDSEEGQTFYAGGSEHSGELIMGPKKKKKASDIIDNMFKSAKDHGAEVVEPGSSSEKTSQRPVFRGAGYRLGDDNEGSSHLVAGEPVNEPPKQVDVTLKLWKNGFSVDDGDVRDYADPANKDFLDSIHRGEVPRELIRLARGGEVNLNMEDHRETDFVKPKVKAKAFSGAGHTLGSPTPTVTTNPLASAAQTKSNTDAAKSTVKVDESQPVTNLQIRLADGSRVIAKFNHTHTVSDIRNFIITGHPQYANRSFVLMTTFPNKELTQENETLEQAKLLNAVLVQRLK